MRKNALTKDGIRCKDGVIVEHLETYGISGVTWGVEDLEREVGAREDLKEKEEVDEGSVVEVSFASQLDVLSRKES